MRILSMAISARRGGWVGKGASARGERLLSPRVRKLSNASEAKQLGVLLLPGTFGGEQTR